MSGPLAHGLYSTKATLSVVRARDGRWVWSGVGMEGGCGQGGQGGTLVAIPWPVRQTTGQSDRGRAVLQSTVHVWIDGSSLGRDPNVKQPRE